MPIDLSGVKWDSGPVNAPAKVSTPQEFAKVYGPAAERAGKALGVDASVILGQWGLETGWGKSIIPGTNNLGNIKDFSGGGVGATDNMTGSRDKYRAYASPDAFADDFVSLIQRKYPGAVGSGADAAKFTSGLKGYAEDPNYAAKVGQAAGMTGAKQSPVLAAAGKVADAVIPSAQAAEVIDLSGVKWDAEPAAPAVKDEPGFLQNLMVGAVRGAGGIGATILAPIDAAARAMGIQNDWIGRTDRRQMLDQFANQNADTRSLTYQGGKLGAEIAGTAPIGGILGKAVGAAAPVVAGTRAAPVVNALSNSLATGGFRVGQQITNPLANLALRGVGGAAVGGASAGLVDPDTAGAGALIGGALPVGVKGAGLAGNALRRAVVGQGATPEVAALAKRAAALGIDLRGDQVVNSKPLNALSASLDYVPFSGKGASMEAQQRQFNTALSRTIGENTDNLVQALKNADTRLGAEFDRVLKSTPVTADNAFVDDLIRISKNAQDEMTKDQFGIISKQINNILDKVKTGDVIDADAAYNIKKTLDRLGKSNDSTLAYHAREMRSALMDALNRSLPDGGSAFAKTRQQWGNLMELEKLIPHGAEGNISAARLGNVRNIRSKDLNELADIAAQFLKGRVGDSGTAQRAGIYGLLGAGTAIDPVSVGLGLTAGRGANALLRSATVRNALMTPSVTNPLLETTAPNLLTESLRRVAPLIPSR